MSTRRKQALGKGLGALLGAPAASSPVHHSPMMAALPPVEVAVAEPASDAPSVNGELRYIPIAAIRPNPRQPRRHFDQTSLDELADSIREHGVLQPLLVTPGDTPDDFILLAGERRLRASEIAGRETVPVRVISVTDEERLEIAIIENVQRDDLNPLEEAMAYQQLASSFGHSQDHIAKRVGKSRVAIANSLRLLKLSEKCLADLRDGRLSAGHARAILMLSHALQQEELRKEIVEKNLNVREAENRARAYLEGTPEVAPAKPKKAISQGEQNLDVVTLQEQLTTLLGCKVRIKPRSKTAGSLEIAYSSLDDLDRVFDRLGFNPNEL